ncbi:MAG: hypothetical protein IKV00_08405, partial [Clostridia bacterium]|nr:hypothetical protein [Clostridia bacterium]
MKRTIVKTAIILLVILLTFGLFSCKKDANDSELSDEQKAVRKINEVLTMLKSSSNSTGSEEIMSIIGGERKPTIS